MITVGAIDNTSLEQKAYFSESGPRVDIWAPGVMIMGAYANSAYQTSAVQDPRRSGHYLNKISGTSQATPQVAGLLACLLQLRPEMTPAEAKAMLKDVALDGAIVEEGPQSYSNTRSLLGSNNKFLFMPYSNPVRGKIS
jgi:subtilisin family serine protease